MSSADSPSVAKKPEKQPNVTIHKTFPLGPEVDIFVRVKIHSGLFYLFGTRKVLLQAASSVFQDMLAIAEPRMTYKSIPIVDIVEDYYTVELLLVHLHPGKLTLSSTNLPSGREVGSSALHDAARMAEKYDAPLVLHSLLNTHLPVLYGPERIFPTDCVDAFGLAVVFGATFHVRAALRSFETYKPDRTCDEDDDEDDDENDRKDEGVNNDVRRAKEFNLSHMDHDILARLSVHQIAEFSRVAGRIGPGYSWVRAAREFKVRQDSRSVARRVRRLTAMLINLASVLLP